MSDNLEQQAKKLSSRNYTIEVSVPDKDQENKIFLAKNPEIHGLMAQGASIEEALGNLAETRYEYILSLLEDGIEVPTPASEITQTSFSLSSVTLDTKEFVIEHRQIGVGNVWEEDEYDHDPMGALISA